MRTGNWNNGNGNGTGRISLLELSGRETAEIGSHARGATVSWRCVWQLSERMRPSGSHGRSNLGVGDLSKIVVFLLVSLPTPKGYPQKGHSYRGFASCKLPRERKHGRSGRSFRSLLGRAPVR